MKPTCRLEVEVLPGLETFLQEEWQEKGLPPLVFVEEGKFAAPWSIEVLPKLQSLRVAASFHLVFSVTGHKPSALRSDQLRGVLRESVSALRSQGDFKEQTFRLLLSGRDSAEGKRLIVFLSDTLSLQPEDSTGEHLIRVRRSLYGEGWDLVVRGTAKPLSARPWRVENYRGALHANIAAAVVRLVGESPEVLLDPFCGSGTILIEFLERYAKGAVLGGDVSRAALGACLKNIHQLSSASRALLYRGDAAALPFRFSSVSHVASNLPWGEAHVQKSELSSLHERFLHGLARALRDEGVAVLVTQRADLFKESLQTSGKIGLQLEDTHAVFNGSFRPEILVLRKFGNAREGSDC